MGWKRHESLEDTHDFINMGSAKWSEDGVGPFLIESQEDGAVVGSSGLTLVEPGVVELGYIYARPYWGKGFAGETIQAMVDFARENDFERVIARVHEDNLASAYLLGKYGFSAPKSPLVRGQCPNLDSQDYIQLDYEIRLS